MHVGVVGGGIIGFACALRILEYFRKLNLPLDVTVVSEFFTPHTTGDGSAGFWGPFLLGSTPTEKIHQWSKSMHEFLQELWLSEDAGEAGVCLIPVVSLTSTDISNDVFWRDIVYGFRSLAQRQLETFNVSKQEKFR